MLCSFSFRDRLVGAVIDVQSDQAEDSCNAPDLGANCSYALFKHEAIMKIGKDSVVMGNVPPNAQVGDGSVVIGATDSCGNTILNTSMAIGRGAQAGAGSIAIGTFANAGPGKQQVIAELQASLQEFSELLAKNQNDTLARAFSEFRSALRQPEPDKSLILRSWDGVKAVATINGAHTLLTKISPLLFSLLGQ